MAYSNYLNLEKMAMVIIESSLSQITETNKNKDEEGDEDLNYKAFVNNLRHGLVAVVFCINLYETTINTILGNEVGYLDEEILRCSSEVKLALICRHYNVDISSLKSTNEYRLMKEVNTLRNDMVHFKNGDFGVSSWFSTEARISFGKTKKSYANIFVHSQINEYYTGVLGFLKLLCSKCGLFINDGCEILDSDGYNDIYTFIEKIEKIDKKTRSQMHQERK